jgi:hypothetical protein
MDDGWRGSPECFRASDTFVVLFFDILKMVRVPCPDRGCAGFMREKGAWKGFVLGK